MAKKTKTKTEKKKAAVDKTETKENSDGAQVEEEVAASTPKSGEAHPDLADLAKHGLIFAQILRLLLRSAGHKHLFLTDLEWLVLPPLRLGQFRIFQQNNEPVAYVAWARVNNEVEERLKKGFMKLKPSDWNSGDNVWLIDVIARAGHYEPVIKTMREQVFKDSTVKMLRPNPKGGAPEVVEL